jgi:membrane-associated HD superfamily phosphohydrolase
MERYLQIGKINLKLNLLPHLLIALVFLLVSPLMMGVENLDAARTAKVLELYVALLGIILLTPIFLPEQNQDIKDLMGSKYTSVTAVILIRVLEAFFSMAILIGGFILLLKQNYCSFPEMKYYLGTIAEAAFLGGLGFCAYSITDQIAIAYMVPMIYYILNYGSGKKLLKDFYLFSMAYGGYHEKVYLAITGFVLIVIGICYPYVNRRFFPKLWRHNVNTNCC